MSLILARNGWASLSPNISVVGGQPAVPAVVPDLLSLCRFLGRLHDAAMHARRRQASEKRQGTKSR